MSAKHSAVAYYIKNDPTFLGPYEIQKVNQYCHKGLYEVQSRTGFKHGGWFVSFNGNSKQRRQQRRKLLKELNQ